MKVSSAALAGCIFASAAAGFTTAAAAEDTPTLAGKTVQLVIGFGTGGGYDMWGRIVSRFLGRHLPGNPTVIAENKPGAGSYTAAAYLYNVAPNDGTVIGLMGRDAPLGPITGAVGARFDPAKMSWLGTPTTETNVCISEKTAKVQSVADLYNTQLIMGDVGPGSGTRAYPLALNALLGMKFKQISGFPSSADIFLAMERGEVDGICESFDSIKDRQPTWIPSGHVNVLFQGGVAADPDIKAPFIEDLAKTQHDKDAIAFLYVGQGVGRPFAAPPGMAPATLKMLQDGFAATMSDKDFIAEADREKLTLRPHDGTYLTNLIQHIYATPKPLVSEVAKMING
jgi:tripartite-type tricarboxylate transporter receptor subunit TctC